MARFSKGVSRLHARESREAIRARYLGADEGSRNRAEREENPRDGRERQNDLGPGKGTRFDQGLHQRLWKREGKLLEDLQYKFKHVGPSTARTFLWSVGYPLSPTAEEKRWMKGHPEDH